jgi:hypothetical protein
MVLPDRSKTRQSHLLPRFATTTSNIRNKYETNQKGLRERRFYGGEIFVTNRFHLEFGHA